MTRTTPQATPDKTENVKSCEVYADATVNTKKDSVIA